MTTPPIELTRTINGEPMMSADAMALLFGIDAKTIRYQLALSGVVPPEWLRAGRRRASEAAAATGSRDVFDVLRYWARRDLGAEIVFTDAWSDRVANHRGPHDPDRATGEGE